jgi:hypothetical protein
MCKPEGEKALNGIICMIENREGCGDYFQEIFLIRIEWGQ